MDDKNIESLKSLAAQWLEWDFNQENRNDIKQLLDQQQWTELEKRLKNRIAFGTAGLRGTMQAGFSSMNDLTIVEASQGLCVYLEKTVEDFKSKGVAIGYDGRYHSKAFADLTAAAFLSRGVTVYKFTRLVPTPLVPFCVVQRGCAAGIMVTASHNPKDDNGYKVYWSNGCQIVSPHDSGIAKCINENLVPWSNVDYVHVDQALLSGTQQGLLKDPTDSVAQEYFKIIVQKCSFYHDNPINKESKLPIVYTAMHGVGKPWAAHALEAFNLPPYIPVTAQVEPDPEFPTVPFPNPEEGKGALRLAMETADANNAPIIIANDPDADRLAAAEKQKDGQWKIFNGNEIGILLAYWVWSQYKQRHPNVDPAQCVVINTTVSSKMLAALAKKEGLYYEETLTGFKWIGNKAEELMKKGKTFLYAYEEAIGYMVSDVCLDKDGVRGAGVFAEMANYLYSQKNMNCEEQLQELYKQYGYFASNNRYFFCYDPKVMEAIFTKIRNQGQYCDHVGSFKVKNIRDLTTGYDNTQPNNKAILPTSSSTHMITFFFENGCVATLRGSGTEPKLKYYVELNGSNQEEVRTTLNNVVQAIIDQLLEPKQNGLEPPRD